MRFDLVDLRVLLNACESASLTEAAERSHLTLAAVSARIKALEENTGVALFTRHARGVKVTAAGEVLARHARLVFGQVDALRSDLAPAGPKARDTIVLLANSSALARPLQGAIRDVLRRYPQARIAVRESGSEVTVHALLRGDAELGIVSDAIGTTQGLVTDDLGADPLVMVAAATHPLCGRESLTFEALLDEPWVGWGEGTALHTLLALQALRAKRSLQWRATIPNVASVIDLVAGGSGIAVLPLALVQGRSDVATVPLTDAWARRRLVLCRRAGALPEAVVDLARGLQGIV